MSNVKRFCFQDSSEDDISGKGAKKLAFGSRTSIRRSTEPSTSEESKEGDDSESGGDGAGREEGKGKKGERAGREKGGKNGEKDVKSDKEKIKGATMTTPKKVGFRNWKCLLKRLEKSFIYNQVGLKLFWRPS